MNQHPRERLHQSSQNLQKLPKFFSHFTVKEEMLTHPEPEIVELLTILPGLGFEAEIKT